MTLRLLYLIVIRVCGWLALLGCGPASRQQRSGSPARRAGDAAGLAPPPRRACMDLSQPARTPGGQPGYPGSGAAARAGEPGPGVPQGARRTGSSGPPHQRADRAADPAPPSPPGSRPSGQLLAGLPPRPGRRPAGRRFLPRRHGLPQTPVRAVRHAGGEPARTVSGAPPTPMARGQRSTPATSRWTPVTGSTRSASSSATVTPSSPAPATQSLPAKA